MKNKLFIFAVLLVVLIFALLNLFFKVDQTQIAILLQLGKPVRQILEPGLNIKIPFLQNVIFFDKRILDYDSSPAEILTQDKKNLVVDNYAKWRIVDPLLFYQTVNNFIGAQARLDDIIYSELRIVLGRHTLQEIVAIKRKELMKEITINSNKSSIKYGIEILDVRIKRADLPTENERFVYERMKAERNQQAKKYRSEGMEEAQKIKSETDKEKTIILSEANRESEIIRGEGEAKTIQIYGDAYSKNTEFYEFYRTMEAYKYSIDNKSKIVVTPESTFLKYLK